MWDDFGILPGFSVGFVYLLFLFHYALLLSSPFLILTFSSNFLLTGLEELFVFSIAQSFFSILIHLL
jgi:hypothetical protein